MPWPRVASRLFDHKYYLRKVLLCSRPLFFFQSGFYIADLYPVCQKSPQISRAISRLGFCL